MRVGFFIERPGSGSDTAENNVNSVSVEASPQNEILLEEMRRRYDLQQREIDYLNTKAGVVLGYLGAVLVLLATTDPAAVMEVVLTVKSPAFCLVLLIMLLCSASMVCCYKAYRPRTFFAPVAVEPDRIKDYLAMDRNSMVLKLVANYSEYIQRNMAEVNGRMRWFQASLLLGILFTVVSVCTVLFVQV